jgi:hypothetical protein
MSHQCIYLHMDGRRCRKLVMYREDFCPQHLAYKLKNESISDKYLDNYPTEIIRYLFLGSQKKVCNENWLAANNIKTVVNATDDPMCEYTSEIKYVMLNMIDHPDQNIIPYLEEIAKLIDRAIWQKTGILIHCHMGISRSASLVWYWLATRKYGGNVRDALKFMEAKRWIVNPNSGFKRQIKNYVKSIYG